MNVMRIQQCVYSAMYNGVGFAPTVAISNLSTWQFCFQGCGQTNQFTRPSINHSPSKAAPDTLENNSVLSIQPVEWLGLHVFDLLNRMSMGHCEKHASMFV